MHHTARLVALSRRCGSHNPFYPGTRGESLIQEPVSRNVIRLGMVGRPPMLIPATSRLGETVQIWQNVSDTAALDECGLATRCPGSEREFVRSSAARTETTRQGPERASSVDQRPKQFTSLATQRATGKARTRLWGRLLSARRRAAARTVRGRCRPAPMKPRESRQHLPER